MYSPDIVLHATRGVITESMHRGHLAIADPSGQVHYSAGDPSAFIYARSSMKPIQALSVIESGAADAYCFTEEEIAIICASHSGEERHTATVDSMLRKLGLPPDCLLCGPHIPYDAISAAKLTEAGKKFSELHNNCSGKHAGMLALSLHLHADIKSYTAPEHPVQQLMRRTVSEASGFPEHELALGTDGCGVPVFGLPLNRLAAAFAAFGMWSRQDNGTARAKAACRIVDALRKHPYHLAGTDRYDTLLIEASHGRIIGKMGAEGVFALTVPEIGMGLALKIEDGAERALYPVVTEALLQLGWLRPAEGQALERFHRPEILNWRGTQVGQLEPVFRLKPGSGRRAD